MGAAQGRAVLENGLGMTKEGGLHSGRGNKEGRRVVVPNEVEGGVRSVKLGWASGKHTQTLFASQSLGVHEKLLNPDCSWSASSQNKLLHIIQIETIPLFLWALPRLGACTVARSFPPTQQPQSCPRQPHDQLSTESRVGWKCPMGGTA